MSDELRQQYAKRGSGRHAVIVRVVDGKDYVDYKAFTDMLAQVSALGSSRATSGAASGEVPKALREWATLPAEREDVQWDSGYEAARRFVKMQLNATPADNACWNCGLPSQKHSDGSNCHVCNAPFLATQSASTAPGQAEDEKNMDDKMKTGG